MTRIDPPTEPRGAAVCNQRGVALLIVLVIVALLTILVTEFTYSVQLDQHRTRNAIHAMQAQLLARSGINLAEAFLMLDDDQTYDSYTEDWYMRLVEFCHGVQLDESTQLRCTVSDESGKLNINNTRGTARRVASQSVTADAILRDAMRCMFSRRNIDVEIIDRLADYWEQEPQLKADGTPQQVPDFTSLEDFGATFGIPGQQVRQLRNVLTALPTRWRQRINVNAAPKQSEVLAAILTDNAPQDCGPNDSTNAILQRLNDGDPFKNTAELSAVITSGNNATQKRTLFDVKSHIFRLEASAVTNLDPSNPQSGGIGQTLSTLVYRAIGTQAAPGVQPQMGANGKPIPNWTLRPLDWQKEGGARLFRVTPSDDGQPGGSDDQGEPGGAVPPNG